MDITLTINGRDFSGRVATYRVNRLLEDVRTVVTLDGTEHTAQRRRAEITFSIIPFTGTDSAADYLALAGLPANVSFTDPQSGTTAVTQMRLASDVDAVFGLKSSDGNIYYKGGEIVLRAVSCE